MTQKTDNILKTARARFKESVDAEQQNREQSLDDVKFENGEQWDQQALAEREGRPCLVINKVAGTVKQILGNARQNRPRIKVRPVDDEADPQTAELITGLIRNIENVSDAESAYDHGHDCAVRGGYGFWRVLTQYADDSAFEQDILIRRITNPYSVYFDQSAQEQDYSDARYAFVTETLSREEFNRQYPDVEGAEWEKSTGENEVEWFSEETVRVAEYWYKEPITKTIYLLHDGRTVDTLPAGNELETEQGRFVLGADGMPVAQIMKERQVKTHKVMWCKITGNTVLEGPQEWAGKYIPIVPCLGEEIWIEGRRILRSAIRWAKDPQKLYNWARSTAAETIAMAPKQPWLLTPEQIEGHEAQWQRSHRTPQPYLLYNTSAGAPPQRQMASIPDSGALQEARQSSDDLKATTGLFDASLGAGGNETSGRAILARQKEGDTATFVFTDNQSRALKYTGRILVDLIPKIYDTPRVVRLLGQDGAETWAQINQEDPMTGQKINDLSLGKYDVVVDVGPGYMTKRMEAADGMVQLLQSAPQYAPLIIPRIAKNLDWPEADEIAQEMAQMNQPQPDPMQDQMREMGMAKEQLGVESKQLDIAKKQQDIAKQAGQQNEETYQIAMQAVSDAFRQLGLIQ